MLFPFDCGYIAWSAVIIAKTYGWSNDKKGELFLSDFGSITRPCSELKPTQTIESINGFNSGIYLTKNLMMK